jgi:hypothetical protein
MIHISHLSRRLPLQHEEEHGKEKAPTAHREIGNAKEVIFAS